MHNAHHEHTYIIDWLKRRRRKNSFRVQNVRKMPSKFIFFKLCESSSCHAIDGRITLQRIDRCLLLLVIYFIHSSMICAIQRTTPYSPCVGHATDRRQTDMQWMNSNQYALAIIYFFSFVRITKLYCLREPSLFVFGWAIAIKKQERKMKHKKRNSVK